MRKEKERDKRTYQRKNMAREEPKMILGFTKNPRIELGFA